jgi:hypothetical protein
VGEAARTSRLSAAGRPSAARRLFLSPRIALADKWCGRQPLRFAEPFELHLKSSIQGKMVRCIPDRSTIASIPRSGRSQWPLAGLSSISFCSSSALTVWRAIEFHDAAEQRNDAATATPSILAYTFVYLFHPLSCPVLTFVQLSGGERFLCSRLLQTDAQKRLTTHEYATNDSDRLSTEGASCVAKIRDEITVPRSESQGRRDKLVFAGMRVLRGTLK